MFPFKDAILSFADEIKQIEAEKESALQAAQNAADALTGMTEARDAAEQALARYERTIAENQRVIGQHVATILDLQKRPVAGIARKPTIDKSTMQDVAGVAIPKGNAPGALQDQNARDMMLLWAMMGGNAWRGFFNLSEVKAHAAMLESNINHLPGYGRRLGLTFFADTLNNPAVNLSDVDLKAYLEGIRKMAGAGPFIGYFDDANQYLNELKYPKGTLERLVGRIRQYAPDIILVASLTAGADIGTYKRTGLFDFVEAQTFGKIGELSGMLSKGFDVYCLDGRKEISVDYLTQSAEILTAKNPRNFFYYVTSITDWRGMGEKIPLIKQAVSRWWTLPR